MKQEGKTSKVILDLAWKSDEAIFNYDTDMSTFAAAKAFAKEPWNRQFFKDLKKAHQTHYEQMGRIDGALIFLDNELNDSENVQTAKEQSIPIQMPSFRDHSFGITILYEKDYFFLFIKLFYLLHQIDTLNLKIYRI